MSEQQKLYEENQEHIREIVKQLPALEGIKNFYEDVEATVTLTTKELNSICPRTGMPDFGQLRLQYIPKEQVVEEKSFKMYLTAFRSIGIFKEFMTQQIFKDFCDTIKPKWAAIHAEFEPRGGIPSIVDIEYHSELQEQLGDGYTGPRVSKGGGGCGSGHCSCK